MSGKPLSEERSPFVAALAIATVSGLRSGLFLIRLTPHRDDEVPPDRKLKSRTGEE
jgi:hypothetical protein